MSTKQLIEEIIAKVPRGRNRDGPLYTQAMQFPYCSIEVQYKNEETNDVVCLKVTESYFTPEFKPRWRSDLQFAGLRTAYRTFGEDLDEVEYEGITPAGGKFSHATSLARWRDSTDGRHLLLDDISRFEDLLRYVKSQLQ